MKRFLVYLLVLIIFGLGISLTLEQGRKLPAPQSGEPHLRLNSSSPGGVEGIGPSASLLVNLRENFQDPLTRLFVQLILIVMAARLCGMAAVRIRQAAVIGEMVAGILLGPSLLGWVWPDLFQ